MKIKLLALALLAGSFCKAQSIYNWVKYVGTTTDEQSKTIALDASGNVFVAGTFKGSVDFDPGTGSYPLSASGASQDIFITKYDASGNYLWAIKFGNANEDVINGIAVDATGNVYAVGYFAGTVDFDPGTGTHDLTAAGSADAFVLKLDAAGNYVWAKPIGGAGSGSEIGIAITIDASGNVITAGNYSGSVTDFDPGSGTQTLPHAGVTDIFICKWDASGNYIWAKSMGGNSVDSPVVITTDASGNVYTTGYFISATNDFDPGAGVTTIPNAGLTDIFISKLDVNGDFVWAKSMGSATYESGQAIGVDGNGNVYITGGFAARIDFDPGAAAFELTPTGTDIFVLKLNAAGDFVWAKQIGGAGDQYANSLALDAAGNVYTTGYYTNTTDFDPDATSVYNLNNGGGNDIFISKLSAAGNFVWAKSISSANDQTGVAIAVNGIDNVYLTGHFKGTVDFDPGAGTQTRAASGTGFDSFIAHYGPSSSLPLTLLNLQAENNGHDVRLKWQTSQEENTKAFVIERSADGKNFDAVGLVNAVNNASFKNNYTFNDAHPVNGTVYYRLKMTDMDGRFTYSHIVSVKGNYNGALQLSPNPTSNVLYVQAKGNEQVTARITDVNGRILQQQTVTLNGNTSFSVNIQALLPGHYYLTVKGNKMNLVQPFLKH
jgi:hypothetical protein